MHLARRTLTLPRLRLGTLPLPLRSAGEGNFLVHAGISNGRIEQAPSRWLKMPDGDCFVIAVDRGLIEPCVDLGDPVTKGQIVARIHDFERTGRAPAEYCARRDGILTGRHFPGRVQPGDCLAVIAVAG